MLRQARRGRQAEESPSLKNPRLGHPWAALPIEFEFHAERAYPAAFVCV